MRREEEKKSDKQLYALQDAEGFIYGLVWSLTGDDVYKKIYDKVSDILPSPDNLSVVKLSFSKGVALLM